MFYLAKADYSPCPIEESQESQGQAVSVSPVLDVIKPFTVVTYGRNLQL